MRLARYRIVRLSPPRDSFLLLSLSTKSGLTGWGELTGSGNDRAAMVFAEDALRAMLGRGASAAGGGLTGLQCFRAPPMRDRCAVTAWSAIAQAMWDLDAQARELPLYRLLGAGRGARVPLYANLNRGLLGDRRPEAFAAHAERAIAAGFAFAKATPFDEITPAETNHAALAPAMARLEAAAAAIGPASLAVDGHWRLNPGLAETFMDWQGRAGGLHWVEDLLQVDLSPQAVARFRARYSGVTWAGGEDLTCLAEARRLLDDPARPDVFMPDVKYLWPPDRLCALLELARQRGCRRSIHNPSGPVATAFSAHLSAACGLEEALEFPFLAVTDRQALTCPVEPVRDGAYHLSERPGLGVAPSHRALESFGTVLLEGKDG